jgi:hypothetical protein
LETSFKEVIRINEVLWVSSYPVGCYLYQKEEIHGHEDTDVKTLQEDSQSSVSLEERLQQKPTFGHCDLEFPASRTVQK